MEGIEAYFLKDGNELKLNADQGHYDRKQKKVHVEGHVEARQVTAWCFMRRT